MTWCEKVSALRKGPTMIAEMVMRKQQGKFLAALEAMDAERVGRLFPEDAVVEFPAGTPMAGEWRGRAEITAVFAAMFAHNVSISVSDEWYVAALHPWSPTGTMRLYGEWRLTEVGVDGDVWRSGEVVVMEVRHRRIVRVRALFHDLPGLVAHYADMSLPPRQAAPSATSAGP